METKAQKIELVSVYLLDEYPELMEITGLNECDYLKDDPLVFFEGHSDMVKHEGYTEYFADIDINDTKYIISNTDEPDVWDMLEKFFSADFGESFELTEPNNWDSWYSLKNGIAYRGGRGYVYTIWELTTNNN